MSVDGHVTLYTGGHHGTETEFGRNAEAFGIQEVHFTWPGRTIEREKHAKILDDAALTKGDISMEIVSKRMGRSYTRVDAIRKVMQLLFHIINSGYQVFAVGWIQPDGTVRGGTGWGVELAKLFNRPVSVFDQKENRWYSWDLHKWIPDTPTIAHATFAATGTRNITEEAKAAIAELFKRSFS